MTDFQRFIARLIRQYRTANAVADLIPMSLSAFTRGVRNENTLNVENCLLLAEAVGEDPLKVLRLAGKDSVADVIERNFGAPRAPLSAQDRALLDLDLPVKQQLLRLVVDLSKSPRKK